MFWTGIFGLTQSFALTGGPDAFGYRFVDSNEPGRPTYNLEDISVTGTRVPGFSDDNVVGPFDLGFTFEFYGQDYSQLWIGSNGFLTFLSGQSQGCCSSEPIPDTRSPNACIFGWYEDIYPPVGDVYIQTLGEAPNRRWICQWQTVRLFGNDNTVTFEFKLFENDNSVEVHYQQAVTDGGYYAAGIENADGTVGLEYYRSSASLSPPLAVTYFDKPKVVSVVPAEVNPTSATLVTYMATISEDVTGVDIDDFYTMGTMTAASIVSVTEQTPSTYLVKFDEPVDGVDPVDFDVVTTGPISGIFVIPGSRAFDKALDLTNNNETNGDYIFLGNDASLQVAQVTLEAARGIIRPLRLPPTSGRMLP